MRFVALLRGVNVGGKSKLPMAALRQSLESADYNQVKTYIQSGNIIFESDNNDELAHTTHIEQTIKKDFDLSVPVVVINQARFEHIAANTPAGWGKDADRKYNYIFLRPPYDIDEVMAGIGQLNPDLESITNGDGVLYQSMSVSLLGRTTTGKLTSKPVYQRMTVRNHNTVQKLVALLADSE